MTRINYEKLATKGGPGLGSRDVGPGCGLHKNWAHNRTLFDFSGAAATENVITFPTAGYIHACYLSVNEAVAASVVLNVGYIRGATTDDDYFVDDYATAAAVAAGEVVSLTMTNHAVPAGSTITVNQEGGAGAGTGWIIVEYTIDDEE